MRDFLFDLRYAGRTLRLNPGFATVAIVTLALGIGGTTAIFSVLDPVLIRPLPYAEPERLVSVATWWPSDRFEFLTSADYAEFLRQSHTLESVAAYPRGLDKKNLVAAGASVRAVVTRVTPSFFSTLGIEPAVGRTFLATESRSDPPNIAILTYGLWMRAFGGDPGVVGRAISLDQEAFTVIGVLPASFRFPEEEKIDVFTQLPTGDALMRAEMRTWRCIGRIKPGVSLAQVQAELATIFERIRAQHSGFYRNDVQLRVMPLRLHQVRDVRTGLLVLAGAVGFVLLIACANVAHILLARAASRAREIAVRTALGAGRIRLVRQLLTESALIGVLGGAVGCFLAFAGLRAAAHILPADIPHIDQVAVDWRALGFTAIVAIAAGMLFGLAPVSSALRTNIIEILKLGAGMGPSRGSFRGVLLAAEIAFSMVLLTGATLLVQSLWQMEETIGFHPEHVVVASIPLEGTRQAKDPQQREFLHEALEGAGRLPGVTAAALANSLPPGNGGLQPFSRADRPFPEPGSRDTMLLGIVTENYFQALGIPLLHGRTFTANDGKTAPAVTVVNQALVRRYFPNEDPIGKQIGGLYPTFHWTTIVGVVGDEKNEGMRSDPQPQAYSPLAQQDALEDAWLVVRTTGDPSNTAAVVRGELRDIDNTLPVTVQTMPEQLAEVLARPRFQTLMMAIFSLLALVMAAVGVYGVASWSVAQRTREIGVRMALGAAPGDVSRLVLRGAVGPLFAGIVTGTAGALAATRYLESLLFGVKPNDVFTLAMAASVLAATALLATYIPARRAASTNPAVTLRSE
jgi:putative ABC transport system permease protein